MGIAFKNAKADLVTGGGDVYTCPASTEAIVLSILVSNVDGTNSADVSANWTDSSDSDNAASIASTIPVPADSSLELLQRPLVLEAGDKIQGTASANSDLEMTVSVMEKS